jgi:hypothetical protein
MIYLTQNLKEIVMCIYSWVFISTTSYENFAWEEDMICEKVLVDSTVLQSSLCALLLTYLLYFIPLILIGFDKPRDIEQVKTLHVKWMYHYSIIIFTK